MSWLLPSALGIAGVAAAVAVALHFIARSRPLAETLPTARFVPDRPVYARTRSFALSDLVLLLLRIAAIAVVGAAVAGPMFAPRGAVARIVVADRSRSVANVAEVRDSVRALLRAGDVLVTFDSSAASGVGGAVDSLRATGARGSLSAALAAAVRAGVLAAPKADSLELVLVSPFAAEEIDEATTRLRAAWPGRIRLVRVGASAEPTSSGRVEVRAVANDGVQAGLALMRPATPASVRIVRGATTPQDSAWAAGEGHVLVHWPAGADDAAWPRRDSIDAIGAVASAGATLVARFPRVWMLDGRAVARWSDGEPAAVEHTVGAGCIRDVGVLLDPASDLTLREPFRRFVTPLLAECGGNRSSRAADSSVIARLAGVGPVARAAAFRDRASESSVWTPWLLLLGAGLLILEMWMRRSSRGRVA